MEKLTFDQGKFGVKITSTIAVLLFAVFFSYLDAQCPMACNNQVQVSLGVGCETEITPDIMLEGEDNSCSYDVTIYGRNNVPFPDDIVRAHHIGMSLKVEVSEASGNKCWGTIIVEDKSAPVWVKDNPDTIKTVCYDNFAYEDDIPEAVDNCSDQVLISLISDHTEDLDCDDTDTLSARRTQVWQAVDEYGNKSVYCTRVIEYMRIGLDSILFPDNRDDIELPILQACGDWDLNDNHYPDPWVDLDGDGHFDADESESGVPITTDSFSIFPNKSYCEINATYTDKVIPICEKSFKVLRDWSVLDWCTGELLDSFQVVKVLDTIAPEVKVVHDREIKAYSDPYTCSADVRIPAPDSVFDCTSMDYTISYILADKHTGAPSNGLYIDNNVKRIDTRDVGEDGTEWNYYYVIENLPVGLTWLRYSITDDCGNVTYAFTEVVVVDNVPPIPICDEFTVVTLTANGFAKVLAETFDDGSHDNCTDVAFEVRRLEDDLTPSTRCSVENATFRKYVEFCCADAGQEFMVELRVWDDGNGSGIYGDTIPVYKDTNKSGVLGDDVGGIQDEIVYYQTDNYNTCMIVTEVQDKIAPVITCPPNITVDCEADVHDLDIYGLVREDRDSVEAIVIPSDILIAADGPLYDGYAVDNCEVTVTSSALIDIDACQIGTITRTFVATDPGGRTDTCRQVITVENDYYPMKEINWPEDVYLEGCQELSTEPEDLEELDTETENFGFPLYDDDFCSQLAITYEDQMFNFVDDVCFKILREWTVIDWCEYENSQRESGLWTYTQTIKVNDPDDPILTYTSDTSFCTTGPGCGGEIQLVNSATDCTPDDELVWKWEIDAYNNGGTPEFTGTTSDASDYYPVGTHKITWYVQDMCGNQAKTSYLFEVIDCKNPTPYCISEITTVVMPSSGDVEIWASDFDRGSFDNCEGELRFSFTEPDETEEDLGLTHNKVFTCPQDSGMQDLNIYVVDQSDRWDFCTITINIQVNHDCGESTGGGAEANQITGAIMAANNQRISDVQVSLENMQTQNMSYYMTNQDGRFAFSEITVDNDDFKISANKEGIPLNGVTTLDLVMIERHILGIASLDNSYQVIASDINNDEKVSATDIIQLRKLILGIYDELPDNTTWKFVDGSQVYGDPMRPWEYHEYIAINDINPSLHDNNFIGVKVGDVNIDATFNADDRSSTIRSDYDALLSVNDATFRSGQEVRLDFSLSQMDELVGYQLSLAYNDANLEFVDYDSEVLNISEDNLGLTQPGIIAMSWNDVEPVSIYEDEVLFSLVFRAKTNSTISENVSLHNHMTKAEAYTGNLDVADLHLDFTRVDNDETVLLQNRPNPFTDMTEITFILPESGPATLTVYDVTGRVLQQIRGNYSTGKNSIRLEDSMIDADGVLYYQLEYGNHKLSKTMIKIGH